MLKITHKAIPNLPLYATKKPTIALLLHLLEPDPAAISEPQPHVPQTVPMNDSFPDKPLAAILVLNNNPQQPLGNGQHLKTGQNIDNLVGSFENVQNVENMAANEELKVDVEVTSPSSGGLARQGSLAKNNCLCSPTTHAGSFRCRLHRSPSGIQRTKSINSDAKAVDHNETHDMKTNLLNTFSHSHPNDCFGSSALLGHLVVCAM
ncbi:hypothetical protein LXL04_011616 [Taraxacum kok-saghyz]